LGLIGSPDFVTGQNIFLFFNTQLKTALFLAALKGLKNGKQHTAYTYHHPKPSGKICSMFDYTVSSF